MDYTRVEVTSLHYRSSSVRYYAPTSNQQKPVPGKNRLK